jgi:hypothetical protein
LGRAAVAVAVQVVQVVLAAGAERVDLAPDPRRLRPRRPDTPEIEAAVPRER